MRLGTSPNRQSKKEAYTLLTGAELQREIVMHPEGVDGNWSTRKHPFHNETHILATEIKCITRYANRLGFLYFLFLAWLFPL